MLNQFFSHENLKRQASKVAHNFDKVFFFHSLAEPTAHRRKLIFHFINMSQDSSVFLSVVCTITYGDLHFITINIRVEIKDKNNAAYF